MKFKTILLVLLFASGLSRAQSLEPIRQNIDKILEGKQATVGVAIWGSNAEDTLSLNGDLHLPMQSVFKFHLALVAMHQVDQGKLSLDDKITIDQERIALYSHLWSPLREKYPDGAEVSLSEIITNTVAWSDNVGCDLLFELVGGPHVVQSYLHGIGVKDIAVVHKEIEMQALWDRQYANWTTARAANQVLRIFFENKDDLLSPESHHFLLEVLKGTKTGLKDIRAFLPEDAVVAHKTGHSGKNDEGLTGALNNIGIVFLPNGAHFYISVLVSDATESEESCHRIIADIAKTAWDYYLD
jgi:beta-lactamase class A/beta-lactamase class A VEB